MTVSNRQKFLDEFEARIKAEAQSLAQKHTIEQLARLVADYPPTQRKDYSVHAKVPWKLIYAIRIHLLSIRNQTE